MKNLIIAPLKDRQWNLRSKLPLELADRFAVRDVSGVLAKDSLQLWEEYVSKKQMEEVETWHDSLVREYDDQTSDGTDDERLLYYAIAHLRIISPNRTSGSDRIKGSTRKEGLLVSQYTYTVQPIFLEDCEFGFEISVPALESLRLWMPWIEEFCRDWRKYYPLYVSMRLSEKAYLENDLDIRHLLRVAAIEALFGSEKVFGQNAVVPRVMRFVGQGKKVDLYSSYRSEFQHLPKLPLTEQLLRDMYVLRNKIAHGDRIPEKWKKEPLRHATLDHRPLMHADILREAATAVLRLSWGRIVPERLQSVFADKAQMEAFLS
jgi:hypothetical protein